MMKKIPKLGFFIGAIQQGQRVNPFLSNFERTLTNATNVAAQQKQMNTATAMFFKSFFCSASFTLARTGFIWSNRVGFSLSTEYRVCSQLTSEIFRKKLWRHDSNPGPK